MTYDEIAAGDGHGDVWFPPFVPDAEKGVFTLGKRSPTAVPDSELMVGFDHTLFDTTGPVTPFRSSSVVDNKSALAATRPFLSIEGERPQPQMRASRGDNGKVKIHLGDTSVAAPEQSENERQLPEFTVTHQESGRGITLTPHLTVTNHGKLDVYGHADARVLPRDTSHRGIQNLVDYYEAHSENEHIETSDELLIVHDRNTAQA